MGSGLYAIDLKEGTAGAGWPEWLLPGATRGPSRSREISNSDADERLQIDAFELGARTGNGCAACAAIAWVSGVMRLFCSNDERSRLIVDTMRMGRAGEGCECRRVRDPGHEQVMTEEREDHQKPGELKRTHYDLSPSEPLSGLSPAHLDLLKHDACRLTPVPCASLRD